jgi:ComEC/Rec2-related protein
MKAFASVSFDFQERHTWNTRGFLLVFAVVAWLAGIVLSSLLSLSSIVFVPGAIVALLFLIPLRHNRQGRLIMLLFACLLLGASRYALASPLNDPQSIGLHVGAKHVMLQGMVADEPKLSARSRTLVIAVSEIKLGNGWQTAHGTLSVQTLGSEVDDPYGANYGDVVELQGALQAPPPHSSPETVAGMSFPRIAVYQNQGNPLVAFFSQLRLALANIISQALPQPEAALLIALAFSLRTPTLKPLTTVFNAIGCAHLIAPSGYKVTVFAVLMETSIRGSMSLFRSKQRGRLLPAQVRRRQWGIALAVASSVVAYTLLSGAVPAALRAGMMGVLLVIARPLGRRYNVYTALALVALLLSLADPFVLWDTGFLLSFFGTLGIVLFTPYFERLLHPLSHLPFGETIVEIIAVTLAAEVATLPLMAVTFQEVSLIAPIANILTVPLLGTLILLGALVASAGLLFLPLALVFGWIAYPLLWYLVTIANLCFALPFSSIGITIPGNWTTLITWGYYILLASGVYLLRQWQPATEYAPHTRPQRASKPRLSRKTRSILQAVAAVLLVLTTGTAVLASRPANTLIMTFLDVGPAGKSPQGEAIFIRTPDGKTILIDGGSDATSLSQQLDARLPSWQRSLDVVILTSPRADKLTGLQDVVTRYQIGEALDAGMLHPSASYALWRSTLQQHHIRYVPVAQGAVIHVGTQITLQILWPGPHLHKGTDEVRDNSMVVRLLSPQLSLLLMGDVAESTYGLNGLLASLGPNQMTSTIVQLVGEVGKTFPVELERVLQQVHPAYLIVSPASLSSRLRKNTTTTAIALPQTWQTDMPYMRVMQTAQTGSLEVTGKTSGWSVQAIP